VTLPRLYDELADWWPLLSPPGGDYEKEAAWVIHALERVCATPPRTLLELGSGGGNNAWFLKRHFEMTLVDLSPRMLAVSRALNPELEHLEGDMRTLRLGRTFDAVFIHDAVNYMTTAEDLGAALRTAAVHCRPGGAAVFTPDFVRETFAPGHEMDGADGERRAARYCEWRHAAQGDTYVVDYAFMLRQASGEVRVVHDRHVEGLFPRAVWLELMRAAGLDPTIERDEWGRDVFVGLNAG
jgi:trans-aconitate methyltransferase